MEIRVILYLSTVLNSIEIPEKWFEFIWNYSDLRFFHYTVFFLGKRN